MKFLDLNKENAGIAYELFEDAVKAKEVLFRPFENQSAFCRFFMEDQADEVHKIAILEEHGWGFASGCFLRGEDRAYLSMIVVKKRNAGPGNRKNNACLSGRQTPEGKQSFKDRNCFL